MTVADIKEYIDKHTKGIYVRYETVDFVRLYDAMLKVRSMLDELEPKAKWTNNMNGTFTCSKCGAKRPNDNYCGNCGARMNDELEENQ